MVNTTNSNKPTENKFAIFGKEKKKKTVGRVQSHFSIFNAEGNLVIN